MDDDTKQNINLKTHFLFGFLFLFHGFGGFAIAFSVLGFVIL
jgi:hypothetical protein